MPATGERRRGGAPEHRDTHRTVLEHRRGKLTYHLQACLHVMTPVGDPGPSGIRHSGEHVRAEYARLRWKPRSPGIIGAW